MLFTILPITKGPHYVGLPTSIFSDTLNIFSFNKPKKERDPLSRKVFQYFHILSHANIYTNIYLRGSDCSDFTGLETLKSKILNLKSKFQDILMYYSYLA